MKARYQPTREEQHETTLLAKHVPTYPPGRRCMCLYCGAADGCEAASEFTAVGEEVSLELCQRCFEDHQSLALEVMEGTRW